MRAWIAGGVGLGLAVTVIAAQRMGQNRATDDPVEVVILDPVGGAPQSEHKPGCSGCSLAHHRVPTLTVAQFRAALAGYARGPLSAANKHLETLLFHGSHTRELLARHGYGEVAGEHRALLDRELSRSHALVALRVIDEHGVVRAQSGPNRVPIGHKEHLHADRLAQMQSLEFSGTVMRVGLYHLWSRY